MSVTPALMLCNGAVHTAETAIRALNIHYHQTWGVALNRLLIHLYRLLHSLPTSQAMGFPQHEINCLA